MAASCPDAELRRCDLPLPRALKGTVERFRSSLLRCADRKLAHLDATVWNLFPGSLRAKKLAGAVKWVECGVVIPLACFTLIHILTFLGAMRDYTSVRSLLSLQTRLRPIESALTVAGAIGFFACMGLKLRLASSRDARRRLRLLLTGTVISLAP